MSEQSWITIIGLGEDGPSGLSPASLSALANADVVMGPPRHLELVPDLAAETIAWPVPFADGLPILKAQKGRQVCVLASGDPFWFGAGRVIAQHFAPEDWTCLPVPSTFSRAAARLGWSLETTLCLGLHAQPLSILRPYLANGQRAIVLLRDGPAVQSLADYLARLGFEASRLTILEALGGPRENVTACSVRDAATGAFTHPLCVAIEMAGPGLPRCSGLPDEVFETDGVMTKRPIRALTLSALAPRPGERLWDIGSGSGSIATEWLLSDPTCEAIAVECRTDRLALIKCNAEALGVPRLEIVAGHAPQALAGLAPPDAIFLGGGLSAEMLEAVDALSPAGTRLVVNAVSLESEALLTRWSQGKAGSLMRVEISNTRAIGSKRSWQAAYPICQWSGVL